MGRNEDGGWKFGKYWSPSEEGESFLIDLCEEA